MKNKKPGGVEAPGLKTLKMMQCKYNSFTKKPDSKTGYVLSEGEAIFTDSLYLLAPIYIHKRSPAFTLVSQKGKHISGLFKACGGAYLGDFNKQALILFVIGERGFDLFQTDLSPIQARELLCNGSLNEQLFKAREEAKAI